MASPEDILVANLRHALDRSQRYLTLGLGSSVFMLLLIVAAARAGDEPMPVIDLPSGLPDASPIIAASLMLSVYWVSGALSSYMVARAKRIEALLQTYPELHAAALTYPSIATIRVPGPRLLATLLPALLVLTGYGVESITQDTGSLSEPVTYLGLALLVAPYLTLAFELRHPLGGNRPTSPLWRLKPFAPLRASLI